MSKTVIDDLTDFSTELTREEMAAKTIAAYRADLTYFGRWFATSTGETFAATALPRRAGRCYAVPPGSVVKSSSRSAEVSCTPQLPAFRPRTNAPPVASS